VDSVPLKPSPKMRRRLSRTASTKASLLPLKRFRSVDHRAYHHGMELMERFALARRGGFMVGTLMAGIVLIAVFLFGAPPLILIPVSVIGSTIYMELRLHVKRNLESRG